MGNVDDDAASDLLSWNQPFPGAERVPASPVMYEDGRTVLSDGCDNGPSMVPRIIEATAVVNDDHEQLERSNGSVKRREQKTE